MYIADVFEKHSGWRYRKDLSGGGVLMDFGIHMLDQVVSYFGDVDKIEASSRKLYSDEVEDEVNAKLIFKSDVEVMFHTSWSKENYRKSYAKLDIIGEKGRMIVTDQSLEIFDSEEKCVNRFYNPDLYEGTFMDIGGILYSNQIRAFIDLCRDKSSKINTLEDSICLQNLIETIYKSCDLNEPISVEEISWE